MTPYLCEFFNLFYYTVHCNKVYGKGVYQQVLMYFFKMENSRSFTKKNEEICRQLLRQQA